MLIQVKSRTALLKLEKLMIIKTKIMMRELNCLMKMKQIKINMAKLKSNQGDADFFQLTTWMNLKLILVSKITNRVTNQSSLEKQEMSFILLFNKLMIKLCLFPQLMKAKMDSLNDRRLLRSVQLLLRNPNVNSEIIQKSETKIVLLKILKKSDMNRKKKMRKETFTFRSKWWLKISNNQLSLLLLKFLRTLMCYLQ